MVVGVVHSAVNDGRNVRGVAVRCWRGLKATGAQLVSPIGTDLWGTLA